MRPIAYGKPSVDFVAREVKRRATTAERKAARDLYDIDLGVIEDAKQRDTYAKRLYRRLDKVLVPVPVCVSPAGIERAAHDFDPREGTCYFCGKSESTEHPETAGVDHCER